MAEHESPQPGTIFHEHWWLNAVTKGDFEEVSVTSDGKIVGRMPFVVERQMGLKRMRMPHLTHILGPWIDCGSGKVQTRMFRRLSIARDLIGKLPRFDYFKQGHRSTGIEGLAFQERGFRIGMQFNFTIDCRKDLELLWADMNYKARHSVRRAAQRFEVKAVRDPEQFVGFYRQNLATRERDWSVDLSAVPSAFAACQDRNGGEMLSACWPDGRAAAMVFLVWGHGTMYYLLSTRCAHPDNIGSVSLLIWSAMKRAHKLGLVFDLDGVVTTGTARFLGSFGGCLSPRTIVERCNFPYNALRLAKRRIFGADSEETLNFT